MPSIVFAEPGSDATGGLQFHFGAVGSIATSTARSYTGGRSLISDSTAGNAAAYTGANGYLSDAGRRISFRILI